jgi:hypothetical protein
MGNDLRLAPSNSSAAALTQVATYFNGIGRFEEARLYSKAAVASANKNHVVAALATCQLLFALAGLQSDATGGPDPTILTFYRDALLISEWHWGPNNLVQMTLHDRMSCISHKSKNPRKALEYHQASLETAEKSLGKNHSVTAGYLTRVYFTKLGGMLPLQFGNRRRSHLQSDPSS